MIIEVPTCPTCHSKQVVKNGKIHNGKQNHRCKDCGHQFVEDPQQKRISDTTKTLIDDLLLEHLGLPREIQDESSRSDALRKLAKYLPAELLQEALESVWNLKENYFRSNALQGFLSYFEHLSIFL